MEYIAAKPHIRFMGVMSVLPKYAPDELYIKLQGLGKIAKERYGAGIISAGMSGDYEKAVRYGANMIRLGSAIFGQRNYEKRD